MTKSLLSLALVLSGAMAIASFSSSTAVAQSAIVRITTINGQYNLNHVTEIAVQPNEPIVLSADLLTTAGQPTGDATTDFVWQASDSPYDICDAAVPNACATQSNFRVNQYGVVFGLAPNVPSVVISVYSHNPAAVLANGSPSVDTLILENVGAPQPIYPPPPPPIYPVPVRPIPIRPVPIRPGPPIRPPIRPPVRPPVVVHPPVPSPVRPPPVRPPPVRPPVRPPVPVIPPVRPPVVAPPVRPPAPRPPAPRPPAPRPPVVGPPRPPAPRPPAPRPPAPQPIRRR